MFVGWHMKRDVLTITPETSVLKARELMDTHRISHLPVVDERFRLVGIVTDRDLKESWASPASTLSVYELTYALLKLTVESIMTRQVVTAESDMPIERAARIMRDRKIGALPVVEGGKVVGIITSNDLLEVLLIAIGMAEEAARLSVFVRDRMGVLAEMTRSLQQAGVNVRSMFTVPVKEHDEVWQIIVRVRKEAGEAAKAALEAAGFKVLSGYARDPAPWLPA